MGRAWVFGDDGALWPDGDPALAFALGTRRMGPPLTDFVVRNLGFIRLEERRSASIIRYSPITVAPAALDGLCGWLETQRQPRLVIDAPSGAVPALLLASREQITAWFDAVRANRPPVDVWSARRPHPVAAR